MQEVVFIANMATPARFPQTGFRGQRRGANIGRTREIWPTSDGFVSYGLRGGKARVPSLETLTRLVDTPALRAMDWSTFSPNTADDETLRAIENDVAAYFADQHDVGALRHRLRDEPHARPDQLAARDPRQRAARGTRLLRTARRLRAVPVRVRDDRVRRRGRRAVTAVCPRTGTRLGGGARPAYVGELFRSGRRAGYRCLGKPEDPRVRLRRGRTDRDAVLRRARRDRAAGRVEGPPRLPARLRTRPEEPARPRRRADVRRPQRRQARRDLQPQATRRGRSRAPVDLRMGRRGRGELRSQGDARFRLGLRHTRRGKARPRHGQRVPQRPDRTAPQLSRLRRAGFRARRLQLRHRLARSRTRRSARHHHGLTRAALRGDGARGRPALPPPDRSRPASRRLPGGSGDLLALPLAARLPANRHGACARREHRRPCSLPWPARVRARA